MADEKPTIKLRFKDDFKSPTVEVGHGEYGRKFDAKEQPFEVRGFARPVFDGEGKETGEVRTILTADEEAKVLLATGYFEQAESDAPEKLKPARSKPPDKVEANPAASGE